MSDTPPKPSWSGLNSVYENNDLAKQAAYLKNGALYTVAKAAALRGEELAKAKAAALQGKELAKANMAIKQYPDTFDKFAVLPSRGGKKSKSKKNKMKSRRNKIKKNKTNKKRR